MHGLAHNSTLVLEEIAEVVAKRHLAKTQIPALTVGTIALLGFRIVAEAISEYRR